MEIPCPRIFFIASLWLFSSAAIAATPSNPLRTGDAIYLSWQGVHRIDPAGKAIQWVSLAGVETHAPVAWRDLILVGSTQGLYALDADSGRISWHIERQRNVFSPTVSARAYSGSVHGELYAIDPAKGRILWRRQFPGWIYSPAINQASAQLWSGGQPHRVYALDLADGSLQHEIATSQEVVFSPLAIGANRIAFNLFDGTTVVIDAAGGKLAGIVDGDTQPTALQRQGKTVYRGHSDGSLLAFDSDKLEKRWQKALSTQNLQLHPSLPGYLLIGNRDRDLILLDLAQNGDGCSLRGSNGWLSPIQIDAHTVLHFRKQLQPAKLLLVQTRANCK